MADHPGLSALADVIQRQYVFPDVAASVAAEVRGWEPPAGDPPFADWTAALRRHDRHFRVAATRPDRTSVGPADGPRPFLRTSSRGAVAVLRVVEFVDPDGEGRADEIAAALESLGGHDAAVVDLRGNRGGWPTTVALLAGPWFATAEHVVDFRTRTASETSTTVPDDGRYGLVDVPLAVLVDGGTASAAESFAYLMSTTGRATVVGETSAGAANPGDWFDTGEGMWVFVSTGAPVDPRTGTNWEAVGVVPHVRVTSADAEDVAVALLTG